MFKFNNDHIFTGYLKQLLASFHLPKCKVYTKEQRQYVQELPDKIATWTEDLAKLQKTKALLLENITELNDLISLETDQDYLDTLKKIKATYEAEELTVNTKITEISELIKTTPKELNVLQTNYRSDFEIYPNSIAEDLPLTVSYPPAMRYIPYIKDGILQEYTEKGWTNHHRTISESHTKFHEATATPYATIRYSYGQKILNYTKNLKIQNTIYDSYTHEYLGDYLRFHRDFANINLMPLYNCFSNRACPDLDLAFDVGNNYTAIFKTDQSFTNTLYKYYMVPVKFFKNYTIAIESESSIEVCCCIYDEYYNEDDDLINIPKLTYQCFSDLQFKTPVLYSKLQNLNSLLANTDNDLCQYEDSLKLILKIPATNKSSIVILEGNYTTYNDSIAKPTYTTNEAGKTVANAFLKETNKTVINYEKLATCDFLIDKLITPLQLLRTNTGESYPFADRLVEYLVGNAITVNETIQDNIIRAKTVIAANCNPYIKAIVAEDGIWEPILQCLVYDYINEKQNTNDVNHDILGFIDKDAEKWYTAAVLKRNAAGQLELDSLGEPIVTSRETIANIDIYND